MSTRDLTWVIRELKGVHVRNLISPDLLIHTNLPCPRLRLSFGEAERKVVFFDTSSSERTCNPNWTISDVICLRQTEDNTLLSSTFFTVQLFDDEKEGLFFERRVDASTLKFLGPMRLQSLVSLPFNSVIFSSELGLFVPEDLYNLLQKITDGTPLFSGSEPADSRDPEEDEKILSLRVELASSHALMVQLNRQTQTKIDSAASAAALEHTKSAKLALVQRLQSELKRVTSELATEIAAEKSDEDLFRQISKSESTLASCQQLAHDKHELDIACRSKKEEISRAKFLFEVRQLKLISEIQALYPIERHDGIDHIRGLEFPNDHSLVDDDHISSALGYVAHLIILLAKYLELPLRYPIAYAASKSLIRDPMLAGASVIVGQSATLPLYRKGVERDKFEKALTLLQKNIEQIVHSVGLNYNAKSGMLGNLNEVFLHQMCPTLEI